jgi:hypothetical protein
VNRHDFIPSLSLSFARPRAKHTDHFAQLGCPCSTFRPKVICDSRAERIVINYDKKHVNSLEMNAFTELSFAPRLVFPSSNDYPDYESNSTPSLSLSLSVSNNGASRLVRPHPNLLFVSTSFTRIALTFRLPVTLCKELQSSSTFSLVH